VDPQKGRVLALMGRWLERKPNWLKNADRNDSAEPQRNLGGRPQNDSKDYGVRFIPLKCPKCKSKDIKCYSSHPPVRYHICQKCGHNFKSVEAEEDG